MHSIITQISNYLSNSWKSSDPTGHPYCFPFLPLTYPHLRVFQGLRAHNNESNRISTLGRVTLTSCLDIFPIGEWGPNLAYCIYFLPTSWGIVKNKVIKEPPFWTMSWKQVDPCSYPERWDRLALVRRCGSISKCWSTQLGEPILWKHCRKTSSILQVY